MKPALLATTALTIALILIANPQPSRQDGVAPIEPSATQLSEVSAARKKVRRPNVRVRKTPAPVTPYRWRPADPSFDQQGRLYRPPPGLPCPVDLGYGRWTSCWNR